MKFETPLVRYDSIKLDGKEVELDGNYKVSFSSPYNKIDITLSPINTSLSYYEVRVTLDGEPYDIEVGNRAYATTNLPQNRSHNFSIDITPELFDRGDGIYRISLYAKSATDGSWDITYLFFTLDGYLQLADGLTFSVVTTKDAPSSSN